MSKQSIDLLINDFISRDISKEDCLKMHNKNTKEDYI